MGVLNFVSNFLDRVRSFILPFLSFLFFVLFSQFSAAQSSVVVTEGVEYAVHDGVSLAGTLYMPENGENVPLIVAVHGGGWKNGSRVVYEGWGDVLPESGYGLFAISYRLGPDGTYPKAVYDVKAAVQYIRANAAELGVDPERIALWGDSAGGHLATLVSLAADDYVDMYKDDANADVGAGVKATVSFYGVYDLLSQWEHDQVVRPLDNISEKFLGVSPTENRQIYFDASPINHAIVENKSTRFLLIHGTDDDIVGKSMADRFWLNLNMARINSRRIILPGLGHFFAWNTVNDPYINEMVTPRILMWLEENL